MQLQVQCSQPGRQLAPGTQLHQMLLLVVGLLGWMP
jgi:hypothetical protein